MATCVFAVSIQIHNGTGGVLGDLNDQAIGLSVGVPLDNDDDQLRRIVTDSPFVEGNFEILATPDAGRLDVVLLVTGTSWPGVNASYRTARSWWRQAGSFWLDVTIEGDGVRYLARRPDVTAAPLEPGNLFAFDRSWLLSFPIQPNPVVL